MKSLALRHEFKQFLFRRMAIRENVHISSRLHVGPNTVLWAPRRLEIDSDVYIGRNVTVQVDGSIGRGTMIANNVGIIGRQDHDVHDHGKIIRYSRWVGNFPDQLASPTTIGADVWIGFGAIVLSGLVLGDSCIIAAGSVVIKSVPPGEIHGGNPARHLGYRFSSRSELLDHWRLTGISGNHSSE